MARDTDPARGLATAMAVSACIWAALLVGIHLLARLW